jgi:DNA-binding MarR family transcriptional regulator
MTSGHDLAMALRAAYLAMHRRTDAALARYGVTADQFVLLAALARADALTQRELARRTSSDPNTVRAMLLILEERGLITRRPHPSDARARTVTMTRKGRQLYKALWESGEPVRELLLAEFDPDETAVLLGLLSRLSGVLSPPTDVRLRR